MAHGKTVRNTILLRLPDNEFEAIQPHLRFTNLNLATLLQREQETIDSVYFMNRGIASMLVETDDGRSVEVGVSGREDMIGLPLAAGLSYLAGRPDRHQQAGGDPARPRPHRRPARGDHPAGRAGLAARPLARDPAHTGNHHHHAPAGEP